MIIKASIRLFFILSLGLFCFPALRADPAAKSTISPVTICSYNLRNFLDPGCPFKESKPDNEREICLKQLATINADILILIEVGGQPAAEQIRTGLDRLGIDYPFYTIVNGDDNVRHIVILSKIKPKDVQHATDVFYKLKGRMVPVQRGFANCLFEWPNGYQLRLLAAHLKSKRYNKLGQTDMRRYESRQLRYLVNDMILKHPECNLLVMGDFNDGPSSSPLNTLISRRRRQDGQLFDLRPVDDNGFAWTHFWAREDSYSRIDYILANQSVLPEIDFSRTKIVQFQSPFAASDHRPLLVTVHPQDKPLTTKTLAPFKRNIRVPASVKTTGRTPPRE